MEILSRNEIESRILNIRGTNVMVDVDAAEMFQVKTGNLNLSVKRNIERFPSERYMFELNNLEKGELIRNNPRLENLKFSKTNPKAFTEHGVLMLAGILKSEVAVKTSLAIVDVFIEMREELRAIKENQVDGNVLYQMLKELNERIQKLESDGEWNEERFNAIFKKLNKPDQSKKDDPENRIGF